jgi:voltage-gated potassium channel
MTERRFSPIRHIPRYSALLFRALQTPLLVYFVLAGNVLTIISAVLFTLFEKGHNEHVQSYFDGLWWAMTTVTTVGYGDITPLTMGGRLVAVALMVTGILFFVGFAAVIVSAIDTLAAEDISKQSASETTETIVREMHGEMKRLRAELADMKDEMLRRLPPR